MSDTYLKVAEIASYLGKSEQTIRRLIKAGDIPTHKIRTPQGYQYLAKMKDLQQLLHSENKKAEPKKSSKLPSAELLSETKDPEQEAFLLKYQSPLESMEFSKEINEEFIGQEAHFFYPESEQEHIFQLETKIRTLEEKIHVLEKAAVKMPNKPQHFFMIGAGQEIHWYVCSPAYKKMISTLDFTGRLE